MSTESCPEFDVGPLSWVQGEIDQALGKGLEALAIHRASPEDTGALKRARVHVHQAAGAIQMVGLDAIVAYADEIERHLARLEDPAADERIATCDVVDRACRKLAIFLADVAHGALPVPLRLYPEYEALQRMRGARAAPTDLFYPDLSPRAPRGSAADFVPPSRLPSHLIKQRRLYQRGLLGWLRGEEDGAAAMRDAVAGIAEVTTQSTLRTFWWTVVALLEALAERGIEPGFGIKQLAARIDLQIRRVLEGSAKAADRLRREVLYYVAISAPVGPQVQAVQRTFGLAALIPPAESVHADVVGMQPLVREAREQLAAAKDTWLKFASGRAENLGRLKQTLASVHAKAVEMKHGALSTLTGALVERLERMPSAGVSEPLAMEYATALLLAESAFENYTSLSTDFTGQVEAMLARLDAVRAGRMPAGGAAPALDDMSRRAQERMLLGQVGREIRANLRHMEQVLDAFFRDNGKRGELASLAKDTTQIRGALRMLGLDEAEGLLALCQQQIDGYAAGSDPVSNDDLEMLAESLSGLGFYIEAVEQQRPDSERLLGPLVARRTGESATQPIEEHESVETAVAAVRADLPRLVEAAREDAGDGGARDELKRTLAGLRDDAELIGDADLAAQAKTAIRELESGGSEGFAAAVDAISGTSASAPRISEETQRLLEVDATNLDGELVDIYLTEATEVLDAVAAAQAVLSRNPGDRESLRNVRRGFHTLKGSGRMVGLVELGEIAYEVEKIHNRLLEEERPVTAAVIETIAVAEASFRDWIGALRAQGRVVPDPSALHDAIRAVESELPAAESVIASRPAPRPSEESSLPAVRAEAPLVEPVDVEVPVVTAETSSGDSIDADRAIEVIELAELGFDASGSAGGGTIAHETIDFEEVVPIDAPAPVLKLVSDNAHPIAHVGLPPLHPPAIATLRDVSNEAPPLGDVSGPDDSERATIPLLADADDEIAIGDVTLSGSLHRILVDEAQQHLSTLEHDIGVLQFDPHALPSPAMIRAGHTLCGIHRTGGFELVATTAKALELALIALAQRGAPLSATALPALARAIAGLRMLVGRIERRVAFGSADIDEAREIQGELESLRQQATVEGDADAETAAAVAAQEDEPAEAAMTNQVPAGPTPARAESIAPAAEMADAELATVRDEVDAELVAIFLEEAAELFPAAGEQLRAWRRAPHDDSAAQQLRRTLHTFKGSARMAGAMRLGQLTHVMESRLMAGDSLAPGTAPLFEALDTDLDRIAFVLDRLREGESNVALPWLAASTTEVAVSQADGGQRPTVGEGAIVVPLPMAAAETGARVESSVASGAFEPVAGAQPGSRAEVPESEGQRAMLRVRADVIDRLVNEAGEVAITRARVEGELRALKGNLLELTNSVIRLRNQVREIEIQAESQIQSRMTQVHVQQGEYDPLEFDRFTRFQELTRSLAEGVNDVSTVQQALLRNLDDADAALLAQARLSREVQQQLFAIRTVPFGSLSERLYRIVRSVAKDLDKRANLEITGGQTELDRSVLEKLAGPLEHLLRNALDHGIESRESRLAAGKPEAGEITVAVRQSGNEIVIELGDDGAGIDLPRVFERARSLGILAADATPTDAQLLDLIFRPGFSTATRVTPISGRGVGMDVVRSEIAALGGRIEIATRPGGGTRFTLALPLTLAVAQAVLVRSGGRLWALPAPMVEQVQQVKADALPALYAEREVQWQSRAYPFHYLPRLLGDAAHRPEPSRYNPVLLLRSGTTRAAVHVDEMVGNQEIVVKNIGPQLARVSGISGATVLGSGEIVLIINPVQLAQRADIPPFDADVAARAGSAAPRDARRLVMVVDDSLTVRKITSRLLTREGFKVVTAKDGVDALQALATDLPDAILLDIEMPRMDGFEFTKTVRGDPRTSSIPIVMITSRTADKHRSKAAELGVDLYLGKPYQEEDLLRHLRGMLGLVATAA